MPILKLFLLLFVAYAGTVSAQQPDVVLLKTYDATRDNVVGWLMSEKLDGIRAIWNGSELVTRSGAEIHPPHWFIQDFPPFALDGELWTKRNDFDNISSIVRRQKPDERWQTITYNIFEVPDQPGGLRERLLVLENYLNEHPQKHLMVIPQIRIRDKRHLQDVLRNITANGGEGVVVRHPHQPYHSGRSSFDLKVKPYQDAECTVTAILPGKGKYTGKMGSLRCQMPDGREFKIGSGFTDEQRSNPPQIGDVITYKHYGFTSNGIPRFASFLRVRNK